MKIKPVKLNEATLKKVSSFTVKVVNSGRSNEEPTRVRLDIINDVVSRNDLLPIDKVVNLGKSNERYNMIKNRSI